MINQTAVAASRADDVPPLAQQGRRRVSSAPAIFSTIAETWKPEPEVVEQTLTPWPGQALSAVLDAPSVSEGDALPLLWHEVYLRPAYAQADLGADGHPLTSPLVPAIPDRRRMFGGGRISLTAPVRIGDRVSRRSSITQVKLREGKSGWLLLVTELHELSVDGSVRVSDERDIFYRLPDDVAGSPMPPAAPASEHASLSIHPDERLLFLFSALTYNPHRIHYDRQYTTTVEGHPDLVVHGPLLALQGMEVARRELGTLVSADYRLMAPAYCGRQIDFEVESTENGTTTVLGIQDGRKCLSLTATS